MAEPCQEEADAVEAACDLLEQAEAAAAQLVQEAQEAGQALIDIAFAIKLDATAELALCLLQQQGQEAAASTSVSPLSEPLLGEFKSIASGLEEGMKAKQRMLDLCNSEPALMQAFMEARESSETEKVVTTSDGQTVRMRRHKK